LKALKLTLLFALVSVLGCSNQWRDADAEIDSDDMLSMLEEVSEAQGSSSGGGALSEALAFKDDESASIYFGDAPSPLGPVASIASIWDFQFLGADSSFSWREVSEARVFFFDRPSSGSSRDNGLVVGIKKQGEESFTYYGFTGTGTLGKDEFVAELDNGSGTQITLRSFDIEDGDLAPVIQLKIYASGTYIGKFATLVGFGP